MQKPPSCFSVGCPLERLGVGFVPPSGPPGSKVLFLGESPGEVETLTDVPFSGPAGGKLHQLVYRVGRDRADTRVGNIIQCRPPGNKLARTPWEYSIDCCRPNLEKLLGESHRVIVPLGGVPTREILKVGGNLKDFHGTVSRIGDSWVVPTFHPSHLLQGAWNLTGTVLFDLYRAFDVAENGWTPDVPTLHLDPSPAFVEAWIAEYLEAVLQDPLHVWLSVDVETADKERTLDEGELKAADKSMEITRVNLSCRLSEGMTFPFVGPYVELLGRALASLGPKCFWNKTYDLKRLRAIYKPEGIRGALLDFMDAWHALHSDVPKGLGFVAPHYSNWGPWKHLNQTDPVLYAAGDSVQNQRCAFGVAADLQAMGMWDVFWRHMHEVDRVALQPSCAVGLKLNPDKLEVMRGDLETKAAGFWESMQALVPDEIKPLHPRVKHGGWTRRPEGETYLFEGKAKPILEMELEVEVQACQVCGAVQVSKKHRCKDKTLTPDVQVVLRRVPRWFVREDFNPGSPQQVMAYIKASGHKPGREHGKETTNRESLERLAEGKPRSKKDEAARELYRVILDYREVDKIRGTYVVGMLNRLAESTDGRVHPVVTSNPSTLRTAYNSPNLQNVVADKRGKASLAAGFREAVEAEPGCKLMEADWSGIEAVVVGWCMGDPDYIKLAWLGVHDFLTSHAVGEPASLSWPVDDLLRYFAEIKKRFPVERDQAKRIVHGTNYCETVEGIYKRFRKLFKSIRDAQRLQDMYYAIAPRLKPWQQEVKDFAAAHEYVGGPGLHPWGYKHEFYQVKEFRQISQAEAIKRKRFGMPISQMNGRWYAVVEGDDAKRAVAFWGQSIAAADIRETSLLLFDPDAPNYVGDLYYDKTPLRAIIHDSFLDEAPDRNLDRLIERTHREMTRMIPQMPLPPEWGLGPYLQFGVEVKVGPNWSKDAMEKVKGLPQPWLKVLKGDASTEVDLSDRSVADETVDDQEADDPYGSPVDALDFGDVGWSGEAAGKAGVVGGGEDADVPF